MMVIASCATGSSTNDTFADSHACCSSTVIGLDALATSNCPRQNFTKPVPVPENVTVTVVPLLAFMNSCATASASGKAVLDPSRTMGF